MKFFGVSTVLLMVAAETDETQLLQRMSTVKKTHLNSTQVQCPNFIPIGYGGKGNEWCQRVAQRTNNGADPKKVHHCREDRSFSAIYRSCPGACGRKYTPGEYASVKDACQGSGTRALDCWPECDCMGKFDNKKDEDNCYLECRKEAKPEDCKKKPTEILCPNYVSKQSGGDGKQCANLHFNKNKASKCGKLVDGKWQLKKKVALFRQCPGACGRTYTDDGSTGCHSRLSIKEKCRGVLDDRWKNQDWTEPPAQWPMCDCGEKTSFAEQRACYKECVKGEQDCKASEGCYLKDDIFSEDEEEDEDEE